MATDIDTIHGAQYVFGFKDADAPTGLTGFTARKAGSDVEPEVFAEATNGEGAAEATAISLPASRMINLTLVGYISTAFNKLTVPNSFTFLSRFFLIKKISEPRNKGEFIEVTIEAVSKKNITS